MLVPYGTVIDHVVTVHEFVLFDSIVTVYSFTVLEKLAVIVHVCVTVAPQSLVQLSNE
jgi:hypothetical protein